MSIGITKDLIAYVAKLGKLKVDENEMETYLSHLGSVLKSVQGLDGIDTNGVLPFINPMRECLDLFKDHNERRDDTILPSLSSQDILKNAPDQKRNQFKIEAAIRDGV